ncbi:class I SAM-dependent methyltransferase [Mycobacterium sp. MMS18-G62]
MAMARYDQTGHHYARTRRPDSRVAASIERALAGTASVANVGAGTGSYEPPQTVVAVEPSKVMIAQRPTASAPAVRAMAEHLPLATDSVDATLAVLTAHHWQDLDRGLAELVRVARRRVVILTWDHTVTKHFWLMRDYLPVAVETDERLAIPISRFGELPGTVTIHAVPVPHDCADGFAGAYWRRPEAYLDPQIRAGMSLFTQTTDASIDSQLSVLAADLRSGEWHRRNAALLNRTEMDLGYRIVVAEL